LLRELGLQAGPELVKLAANADAFSPADRKDLWNGLADNLVEIKEYDLAKDLCRQVAELLPHDATIRYRLMELALQTHDVHNPGPSLADLDHLLQEIDAIAGRGPLWLYGKALRCKLEAGRENRELLDEALKYAEMAQAARLSWSRPQVLEGEICREKGQDEEALQHYLQALFKGDRDLAFVRLLLQMLYERQRYEEADQVIKHLDSSQTAVTGDIDKIETDILVRSGDFDRALEAANSAYDGNSNDYGEHVWHGRVLRLLARRAQQEDHPEQLPDIVRQAEKSLRRACRIAPNAPECYVELVRLLVAAGQRPKAEIEASNAKDMIPLSYSPLAMGYIYEALGETEKAGESYEKAVKLRPDLSQAVLLLADFLVRTRNFSRAAALVDPFLSGERSASETDLVAARRVKASILESEGYPKLKEALELVDRNLHSPLTTTQDKRQKVRLLLKDPLQHRSPEVLKLAESLVEIGGVEPEPEDRFQLAGLYLARGNWIACRKQMESLVTGSQSSPRYLVAFIRMLLDQDQTDDAARWIERLERVSNTAEAVVFHAELLFRGSGTSGQVPGFLADYISRTTAEPKNPLDRQLVAARLLEDLGSRLTAPAQRGMAETYFTQVRQWYENYVQKRPGGEMLLAGFHARRGKIDEALQQIERYGDKSTPQEVTGVVAAILSRPASGYPETTPLQLKRLDAVVAALLDKTQRPVPLLIGLAQIQAAQDRLADAEKTYREVLQKDPRNDLAGNNLSMILAWQKSHLDEALELIDKTIDRAGPQGPLLDTRAVVLIARHEPGRALENLESALAEKATPLRLFHEAWAYRENGNDEKAKECWQSARKAGLQDAMLAGPEREIYAEIEKQDN
jgi:tetratricopeptide (TPR) repeat protein